MYHIFSLVVSLQTLFAITITNIISSRFRTRSSTLASERDSSSFNRRISTITNVVVTIIIFIINNNIITATIVNMIIIIQIFVSTISDCINITINIVIFDFCGVCLIFILISASIWGEP